MLLTDLVLYASILDEGASKPGEFLAVLLSEPYPGLPPIPPEPGETVFWRSAKRASETKKRNVK